jgi:hypothetical protein
MTSEQASRWFAGLDLGLQCDYTAFVAVERFVVPDPDRADRTTYRFEVRDVRRWPLRTPYPAVIADLRVMYADPPLDGSVLAVDATGVGAAVVELVRAAELAARIVPRVITHGEASAESSVAKKHLVGVIQAALQTRRLRFAEGLELTPVLVRELEHFRVKVTAARNEVFEAWRERDHDDLVLALALALYEADRPVQGGPTIIHRPPRPPGPLGFEMPTTDWAAERGLFGMGRR